MSRLSLLIPSPTATRTAPRLSVALPACIAIGLLFGTGPSSMGSTFGGGRIDGTCSIELESQEVGLRTKGVLPQLDQDNAPQFSNIPENVPSARVAQASHPAEVPVSRKHWGCRRNPHARANSEVLPAVSAIAGSRIWNHFPTKGYRDLTMTMTGATRIPAALTLKAVGCSAAGSGGEASISSGGRGEATCRPW